MTVITDPLEDLKEELQDRVPCDTGEACLSHQQEPGEYFITHAQAQPECGQILCATCTKFMEVLIIRQGLTFSCKACHREDITRDEIVVRHL